MRGWFCIVIGAREHSQVINYQVMFSKGLPNLANARPPVGRSACSSQVPLRRFFPPSLCWNLRGTRALTDIRLRLIQIRQHTLLSTRLPLPCLPLPSLYLIFSRGLAKSGQHEAACRQIGTFL